MNISYALQISPRLDYDIMPKTHAPETGTENWYQIPENLYQFSGTSFSYQMKLEAKFLD